MVVPISRVMSTTRKLTDIGFSNVDEVIQELVERLPKILRVALFNFAAELQFKKGSRL